jgi:flavin-dependent dehydrogenase
MVPDEAPNGSRFDAQAVVIGAGPAGCSAALALAAEGVSVLVAEQGQPGKDKPCGDAFVPAAVGLAQQLGVSMDAFSQCGRPFAGFDLLQSGNLIWRSDLCGETGWIARRAVVDQALRDLVARSCRVAYGMRVVCLMITPHGSALVTTVLGERRVLHARTVILSGGSGCALARDLRLDGAPVLTAAISASLEVRSMPEFPSFLYEPDAPGGYAWIFPVGDHRANVGVCALTPAACRGLKRRTVDFAAKCGTVADGLYGGAEALWSGRGRVWHHAQGIVCCGDAGGLVHPLWGEGITAAFESGRAAGEAIAAYLRGNKKALPDYSRWVSQHFAARYGETAERRSLAALTGIGPVLS